MDQLLRKYELVVVANATLDDEGFAALNQRIASWITAGGGTVSNTNVWGRRPLAYAIAKQTAGIYVQYDFQLAPNSSRELDRNLRIEENVIRYLVVRLDEK